MKVEVKAVCSYSGHSIGANGNVNLRLKSKYSELPNYIQLIQMLNNDVTIKCKPPETEELPMGTFRIKEIKVDGDGEGTISFNSLSTFVEVDNLNRLVTQNKDEVIACVFNADVELEDAEESEADDEEDWD